MAGVIQTKLKASALMEAMAAIAIILTIIIIGTMIFVNVTASTFTGEKIRAQLALDKLSIDTRSSRSFFDEELSDDNIIIKKIVEPYDGNKHLLLIHYRAEDTKHSLLAEKKEIVTVDEE